MIYRQSNKTNIHSFLRISILLSSCLMTVMSMSYMALDMRTPKKCVVVDYPGTNLDVRYEVFDPTKDRLANGVKTVETNSQSKLVIEVFPPDGSEIRRTHENHLISTITNTEGKVPYSTTGSGTVHICISIQELPGRKYARPTLVGMQVNQSGDLDEDEQPNTKDDKGQVSAKRHLSEMERLLMGMVRETNLLLKNADLIKDDEAKFHIKSVDVNAASRWWPMMHVVVLLATGFTQANHVIKFLKTMHII